MATVKGFTPRRYRGKYPSRIRCVIGVARGVVAVGTNCGEWFNVTPATAQGRASFPRCGVDVATYRDSPDYVVTVRVPQ